jgi:hypothetical protein
MAVRMMRFMLALLAAVAVAVLGAALVGGGIGLQHPVERPTPTVTQTGGAR